MASVGENNGEEKSGRGWRNKGGSQLIRKNNKQSESLLTPEDHQNLGTLRSVLRRSLSTNPSEPPKSSAMTESVPRGSTNHGNSQFRYIPQQPGSTQGKDADSDEEEDFYRPHSHNNNDRFRLHDHHAKVGQEPARTQPYVTITKDKYDDDDYGAEFAEGFTEEQPVGQNQLTSNTRKTLHRSNPHETIAEEKESDIEHENDQKGRKSINTSTSGIFKFEGFDSQHSSSSSNSNSLYVSTIAPQQKPLDYAQDTVIHNNYNPNSRENTPKTPNMLSPLTQSSFTASNSSIPSHPSSQRQSLSISRSPRDYLLMRAGSMDSPRTATTIGHSSSGSPATPPTVNQKRRILRRSQQAVQTSPASSVDIMRYSSEIDDVRQFFTFTKHGTKSILSLDLVKKQIKALISQYENTKLAFSVASEAVLQEFEDGDLGLRIYFDLKGNFGDKCLDWHWDSRYATQVIPSIEESFIRDSSTQHQFKLHDGAAHWFEPRKTFRHKHRILAIHAIGPLYTIQKIRVVPVILNTGKVAGFWQNLEESPWPIWRPVLWLRLSQTFPFHNNAVELGKESRHIDNIIQESYFRETSSDIFLDRACLELSAFVDGSFPVYVDLKSFSQLCHLVGWRLNEKEATNCNDLTMEVDDTISSLFTSYQAQRSSYVKDCLVPKQIKALTGSYQGEYLASFPSFFNIQTSMNHLLLLQGGCRTWNEQQGSKELFQSLFGPLIFWLTDPLGYPDSFEPMVTVEEYFHGKKQSDDAASKVPKIYNIKHLLSVGKPNLGEFPKETMPRGSFKTRPYSPISTLSLPKKIKNDAASYSLKQSHRPKQFNSSNQGRLYDQEHELDGYNPDIPLKQLTSHNPIVDLLALEDQMHVFQDGCIAEQLSACAGAEILFFRLVHRCCTVLSATSSSWIYPQFAEKAEKNLNSIRLHFTNQINAILKMSDTRKWQNYSNFGMLGAEESFIIYHRIATKNY